MKPVPANQELGLVLSFLNQPSNPIKAQWQPATPQQHHSNATVPGSASLGTQAV